MLLLTPQFEQPVEGRGGRKRRFHGGCDGGDWMIESARKLDESFGGRGGSEFPFRYQSHNVVHNL